MYNQLRSIITLTLLINNVLLLSAIKITTPVPTFSTKSKVTSNVITKASVSTEKVINTLAAITGVGELCQCIEFYLCNKENVVTSNGNNCTSNQVCCANQWDPGNPNGEPDSSTQLPTTSFVPNCVCIPFYECANYNPLVNTSGDGIINMRRPSACQEPNICCPRDQIIRTPLPQQRIEECGIRRGPGIEKRILIPDDQSQTFFGEFPWMALLLTTGTAPDGTEVKDVFVCGASLLSPSVVLTAAHCISNHNPSSLKVRVGEYSTNGGVIEPLPHQERPVSDIRVHPEFHPIVLLNDLALLSVTTPFDLNSHISPICVPTTNTSYAAPNAYDPNQCMAAGWGRNAFDEGSYQTILRKVDLSIVPRDRCQGQLRKTRLGPKFILHPSFICAGGEPSFDTCQGDGGGPLFCASRDNPKQYIQVGITSWGIGCGGTIPAVYASLEVNGEWLTTAFNSFDILGIFRRGS